MNKTLTQKFFDRPVLTVASELLGKFLVCKINKKIVALPITEVEAYDGFKDKASHAHKGLTERNKPMFGPAGYWYVYFVYGAHWMLNIVTGPKNYPAAVLIRGAGELNGPGKLTKFLKIDRSFNGQKAEPRTGLWIEDRGIIADKIKKTPRIGVAYAGPVWAKKKYRFVIRTHLNNTLSSAIS